MRPVLVFVLLLAGAGCFDRSPAAMNPGTGNNADGPLDAIVIEAFNPAGSRSVVVGGTGVVEASWNATAPFTIKSWTNCFGCITLTMLAPDEDRLDRADCSEVPSTVDVQFSFEGADNHMAFGQARAAGQYRLLFASESDAEVALQLEQGNGDGRAPMQPNGMSLRAYTPAFTSEVDGAEQVTRFSLDLALDGPSIVFTAFLGQPSQGAAVHALASTLGGPSCNLRRDVATSAGASTPLVAATPSSVEGGFNAFLGAGAYTWAGEYRSAPQPFPHVQALAFVIGLPTNA